MRGPSPSRSRNLAALREAGALRAIGYVERLDAVTSELPRASLTHPAHPELVEG